MPTVIDEFVVQIGLDASKFTPQQKKILDDFKKTQEQAVAGAKQVESSAGRVEGAISKVQGKMLGLISLFFGGVGIKQFTQEQTKLAFETGRTAQMFETTTKALSTWRNVAVLTGGSVQGMTGAIGGLITQFQNFSLTGESAVIPYFRALGVDIADTSGRMRKMDDIMLDLADKFSKLDPAKARAFGQALGFDEATISLLIRGRSAVAGLLKEAEAVGTVTKEDAEQAEKLTKAWNEMELSATRLGRTVLNNLTPALVTVANRWTEVFKELNAGVIISPNSLLGRLFGRGGSGAEPSEVWTGGQRPVGGLRAKPGAGGASLATSALARSLQNEIPGLDRFTAFNDTYHQLLGRGSAHSRGQALDFTLKNPAESGAVAEAVRRKLAAMGIDASVIDEYQNPSKGSTGGHLHVQFNSAAAAARYADVAQAGRSGGGGAAGNRTTSVSIGKIDINTQATDSSGIAATIKPAIERSSLVTQAQAGPQ